MTEGEAKVTYDLRERLKLPMTEGEAKVTYD
jgi:hypothetical protein